MVTRKPGHKKLKNGLKAFDAPPPQRIGDTQRVVVETRVHARLDRDRTRRCNVVSHERTAVAGAASLRMKHELLLRGIERRNTFNLGHQLRRNFVHVVIVTLVRLQLQHTRRRLA